MNNRSNIYSRYFTYIKPFTKLPIVRNYGPTIFTLFTITILIFFAIKPTVETILVLQKKLADSDAVLKKVTQKANNLSLGQKNYDNLDQNIKDSINTAIPDSVTLKSVAQSLEQIAKLHEASISALQFQPLVIDVKTDNKVGSIAEIPFTFNIEGTYQNMIALLQDFRTNNRLMSVNNVSMSKTVDGTALIMSLSGVAYYLK